uniref:Retinoblastoma-related protein n=1 Tax=Oxybasis rubra TaxID=3560 RepID=RBR_OXYRB|nr:RecName: Full=Retinoblastoma-related protein [Oxybasis rubra]CAA09736.1 retinoblastoma-related protein [Oxybasis rubra]
MKMEDLFSLLPWLRDVPVQNQFSLDDKMYSDALKLFTESKSILSNNVSPIGSTTPEELERYMFAFILYASKRLGAKTTGDASEGSNQSGITLCQKLKAVKLNLVDFFKELPQFVVKIGPILSDMYGADWEKRLEAKELQANFVHLSLLSKYYKRAYQEFFKTNEVDKEVADPGTSSSDSISDYYRFGWLLFLALRVHAFSRFKDLVTCTNGIVSVLAILIIHIPARLRKFSALDLPLFEKKIDRGVNLVASLCQKYDTSEDEVKHMMEKANELILEILKKNPCSASLCKTENLENIDPDDLTYFEDLLEDSSLPNCISMLEKDYDAAIWNKGDIDERVFVNVDDSLLGSGSLSGGAINISGLREIRCNGLFNETIASPLSPCRSPALHVNGARGGVNIRMISTPVSTAMTTAKWLRTYISPLPSKPSPQLEKYLMSCDRNISSEVVRRAHIIMEAIFPNSALGERCIAGSLPNSNLTDNIWAQQRRLEALKLYYRVLETMCTAEAQLLHANNLTSLLTNERFHRCMLACSAELVLATHKTVTMLFPAVLEKTGITAFDLSKVIESFIRHEDSLPRELRRHLNSLEERLLESMAWEKGSSMDNSLIIARPALSAGINRFGLLAEPMPFLNAMAAHIEVSTGGLPPLPSSCKHEFAAGQNGDIRSPKRACTEYRSVLVERNSFTSPVKDRLINNLKQKLTPPALQSAFASPTRLSPGGGGETCAETGINIFFSKIVKLAAVRINGMIERLEKLEKQSQTQQLREQLRENVYCRFHIILNQRTSLFFNRHIDQIILCAFYGVAKISQYELTFKEIILNYRKQPQCKPQVFRSVFVDWSFSRRNRQGQDHVDIITFYNEVFIPSVKPLLGELGPQGACVKTDLIPESNNDKDGQCPGSPKLSTFPSLPDMSPKKVAKNVYVSPLRSSKMDALISNSSKSYYACVGESTHAFQSPSKDLTAINDRLNSTSKVRGALNFDTDAGLVSDSLVANSLYLQNGNCATTSSVGPLKTEQPDS